MTVWQTDIIFSGCMTISVYPSSDAGVLGVVFDGDGERVLSHALPVKRPVHQHHPGLMDTHRGEKERLTTSPAAPSNSKKPPLPFFRTVSLM